MSLLRRAVEQAARQCAAEPGRPRVSLLLLVGLGGDDEIVFASDDGWSALVAAGSGRLTQLSDPVTNEMKA